jgi:hypothetical protein
MVDGHDPNRADGPDDSQPSGKLRSAPDVNFPAVDEFPSPAPSDPTPVQPNPRLDNNTTQPLLPRPSAPPGPAAAKAKKGFGESSGQSAARYASSRPHTVPPPREMPVDMPAVILEASVLTEAQELPPTNQAPAYILSPDAIRSLGQDNIKTMPGGSNAVAAAAQAQAKAAAHAAQQWSERARPATIVMRPRSASTGQKILAFVAVFVAILLVGALGFIVLETQNLLPGR